MEIETEGKIRHRWSLLEQLMDSRQWRRAEHLCRDLLVEEPESAYLHQTMGRLAIIDGETRKARQHLETSLQHNPEDGYSHYLLSFVCKMENRVAGALTHIEKALSADPGNAFYWRQLGWLSYEANDFLHAREYALRAVALNPRDVETVRLIAAANAQLDETQGGTKGSPERQIEELQKALRLAPDDPFVHYDLSRIFSEELGNLEKAEFHIRSALRVSPDNEDHRKHLFRIIRRQDLLLKIFYAPMGLFYWCLASIPAVSKTPYFGFLLIILLGGLTVLVFVATVCWAIAFFPLAIIYEQLIYAEIRARAEQVRSLGSTLPAFYRLPFPVRFGLFVLLVGAFWAALLAVVRMHSFWVAMEVVIPISLAGVAVYGWMSAYRVNQYRKRARELRVHLAKLVP